MRLSCHGICENLIIEYLCGHGNVKILIFCHNNVKKNSKSISLCCPNCVEILLLYVYDVLITWRSFYRTLCCPYDGRSYYVYAFHGEVQILFLPWKCGDLFISCLCWHDNPFYGKRREYHQIIICIIFPLYKMSN